MADCFRGVTPVQNCQVPMACIEHLQKSCSCSWKRTFAPKQFYERSFKDKDIFAHGITDHQVRPKA